MRIGKICTLTVLVLGTSLTAEDKAKVDEFGDGNVVSFHGVTSFRSDDVKKAVLGDRALIVAAHPEAPLVDYLDLLRRKTLAGYRHAGFPDVEVEVSVRSPLVKVRVVEEGSRFRIGDIHVSGAINIDAKKLVRSLALSRPEGEAVPKNSASVDGTDCKTWVDADGRVVPLEPAKWRRGEPARFDRVSRDQLHALINSRLAEMGFESADFEVELVKDPDHGTVHVQTRILDEGPRSIIRQFVVTGNEKNADDDIVRFLGLREGQFFPKLEQTRAIFKLRDSARFLSQDITCKPHSDGKGVLVEICVTEFPVMPRVSEPLSPEHQAVQQLRRWLTDLDKSSTDLVLEKIQAQKTFKCVLSKDGWLFRQYSTGDASNEDFALVATGGQVGLILPQRRRKLTCSVFDSVVLTGKIGTRLSADLTKPKPGRMSFGLGVTSKSINDHRPPFVMDISLSPVSMAHSFNNLDWKYEWKDHLLTARTEDGFSATIDAETGRLIHCEIVDEESGKATLRVRSAQRVSQADERTH